MLVSQIIHTSYPSINLFDKVSLVLQLMEDYEVQHLPVLNEDKFVGLISKDDAFDADENNSVASLQDQLLRISAKTEEYFLSALKLMSEARLSLIPVVNEQHELVGSISLQDMITTVSKFMETDLPGGIIVLEIEKRNFSFGEISRLVETNDAQIMQFNTNVDATTGVMQVTVKINKVEVSDIVSTFQRYDYHVLYFFGEEEYNNELKDNYNHLMSYLNM
jgi:predicted transcriptional regulator